MRYLIIIFSLVCAMGCSNEKNTKNIVGTNNLVRKPQNEKNLPLKTRVVQNVSYNVILSTYKDLAINSNKLYQSVVELQNNPTEQNMKQAQEDWRLARVPWERSESFLFGPVESLGIDPMIDTWPLNRLDLDSILSMSEPITTKIIGSLGTNVQGFHAIEYLLFGNGVSDNEKSVTELTAKEIEYLLAASKSLAAHCKRLSDAWEFNHNPDEKNNDGYVVVIMNPGLDNKYYPSEQSVIIEFINGMISIVDEVANGKIADPMGESLQDADTTKVESPFAWNSLSDFKNNIESVKMIYTGDKGSMNESGIQDLLAKKNKILSVKVLQSIDESILAIDNISGDEKIPFRQAILDVKGRERVHLAIGKLHELLRLLSDEVLPILNNN